MKHRLPLHLSHVADKIDSKHESSITLCRPEADEKQLCGRSKLFTINTTPGQFLQRELGGIGAASHQPLLMSSSAVSAVGGCRSPGNFVVKRAGGAKSGILTSAASPLASRTQLEVITPSAPQNIRKTSVEASLDTLPSQRSIEEVAEGILAEASANIIRSGVEQDKASPFMLSVQPNPLRASASWGFLSSGVDKEKTFQVALPNGGKPQSRQDRQAAGGPYTKTVILDNRTSQGYIYPSLKVVRFVDEESKPSDNRASALPPNLQYKAVFAPKRSDSRHKLRGGLGPHPVSIPQYRVVHSKESFKA